MSNNNKTRFTLREVLKKPLDFLSSICYIWWLELKSTVKDEGVLIFFLLVPLAYPLLYSWIYNNEVVRDVPVAIVDLSHTASSREFIRDFDAAPDVKAAYYCNSLDEAKNLVGKQAVHGVLYFPSNFDESLNRLTSNSYHNRPQHVLVPPYSSSHQS